MPSAESSSSACMVPSGVRSSWAALAAKRRDCESASSSRESISPSDARSASVSA
ncbi:MAG: hypothetical protein IPN17_34105 [Deltaproteobacteria bacterium]|nr:hypothetical protein [Deltaproteobacteria bacterium]